MPFRSLLHILAALLVLLSLVTGAAAAVQVRVMPASATGVVGSTLSVTVEADSVTSLGGFQFGFAYSTNDLQVVSATVNPAFDQIIAQDPGAGTGAGMIAAAVFNNSPPAGTPVTLATIDFRILTPVSGAITLANVILGQVGGAEIASTAVSGTIAGVNAYGVTFASGGNGTLIGTASQTVISGGNCSTVTALPVTGYHFVNWTEGATVVGTAAALSINSVTATYSYTANFAADPVNGVCGSSNGGTDAIAPAANLCSAGSATTVTGSGPWSWSCSGSNGGSSTYCSAAIDTTGPVLTLSTLAHGAITTNATLNIAGIVSDPSGVSALTINNGAVAVSNGSFSYPVVLQVGANTITTIAIDILGNSTSDTRTITLDPTAPVITISAPADNSTTAQGVATITGTINETSTVTVTVNNGTSQDASITGTAFSATVNLSHGLNSVTSTANTLTGKTASTVRSVTFDSGKPSLAITSPDLDVTTAQNSITITGTVSDFIASAAATVTFNNQAYAPVIINGAFTQQLTIPAEGTYIITATATDGVGNNSRVTRNVIYTAPAIGPVVVPVSQSITFGAVPRLTYGGGSASVSATATSGFPVAISSLTPGVCTVSGTTVTPVSAGICTLSANQAGNPIYLAAAQVTQNVTVDAPPANQITTGADGKTTATVTVTASGATVTLASGTLLTDAAGNPISGALTVTASVMNSAAALPAGLATAHTSDGKVLSALGNSIDITISAGTVLVKTITPAMTVNLALPPSFAAPGASVLYYSFDGTTWRQEGIATVKPDGTVAMPVGHLSVWAVATFIPSVDAVAPDVTGFTISGTSFTLTVPISTFIATDAVGVTGYLLSENAAPPLASDPGWTAAVPTAHLFATWGNHTLYAFAKDAANNISSAKGSPVYIGIKPEVDGVLVEAAANTPAKVEPQLVDAIKSLNFAMKAEIPTPTELLHGDVAPLVNGVPQPDGEINLGDTIVILRRVVGL